MHNSGHLRHVAEGLKGVPLVYALLVRVAHTLSLSGQEMFIDA
jgi:hypothetical protein